MFGTRDPWNLELDLRQHPGSLPDASNLVFLLEEAAQNDGDLFAFTAEIYDIHPISFQIWRPVGPTAENNYELIAYRQVIPSVKEQFEDVRYVVFVVCYSNVQLIYSAKRSYSLMYTLVVRSPQIWQFFANILIKSLLTIFHCTISRQLVMLTVSSTGCI